MQHSMRVQAAKDSIFRRVAETDEEFWARMEREYPGQQNTSPHLISPDQAGQSFDDEPDDEPNDPAIDFSEDDLEDVIPRNTSLRDHAHVMRSGFKWDGDERYPKYEKAPIHRKILDSDGQPAYGLEGHVIERNAHIVRPSLGGEHPLSYPWMHTYYPAGQSDEEGLVAGYNTAQQATQAANQLALWGARHRDSQDILSNYRYVGSEEPYDPSIELPHEAAMRENRA